MISLLTHQPTIYHLLIPLSSMTLGSVDDTNKQTETPLRNDICLQQLMKLMWRKIVFLIARVLQPNKFENIIHFVLLLDIINSHQLLKALGSPAVYKERQINNCQIIFKTWLILFNSIIYLEVRWRGGDIESSDEEFNLEAKTRGQRKTK